MASGKFYHVHISPKQGITQADVEQKLNYAVDWYRYSTGLYVVYSTSDVNTWLTRLKDLVDPGGRLFVCELVPTNRTGWMVKDFWDWLSKARA